MSIILPKDYFIDDLPLQKHHAIKKMEQVMSFVNEQSNQKIIRTASSNNQDTLIELFAKMLSMLKLSSDEDSLKKIISSLSLKAETDKIDSFEKIASINKKSKEKRDEIKIVSKTLKDSHYQIDISKDLISKNNNKMFMISCYARDAYLGRYLIKRNFFYTQEREASADDAYNEILLKMGALKERYYNEIIDVSAIFAQIKKVLDGVVSEIKMEEDTLPTNVNR